MTSGARPIRSMAAIMCSRPCSRMCNDMRIAREEIFGPVLSVIPYEDEEDAIRIANDSIYGLSGAVQSADKARASRVARRIRTGTINIRFGEFLRRGRAVRRL